MQIVLKNFRAEKEKVAQALQSFAREQQLPTAIVQAVDIALEEHLANLLNHGLTDERDHEIKVRFTVASHFTVEVEDDGPPFDPLQAAPVDLTVPLDERPIGGLGIHLMRRYMDELEYERQGGKNVLRMRKRLPHGKSPGSNAI